MRMSYTCFVQWVNGSTKCKTAGLGLSAMWQQHWVTPVNIFYTEMYSYVKAQPFQPTLPLTVRQAIHIKCEHEFQMKFVLGSPDELDHLGFSHICVFLLQTPG